MARELEEKVANAIDDQDTLAHIILRHVKHNTAEVLNVTVGRDSSAKVAYSNDSVAELHLSQEMAQLFMAEMGRQRTELSK